MRATASRSCGKRSSHWSGSRSTLSRLPRRSGSQPSSEVRQRIATSTSWSAVRRGWCACASPVAPVWTPSASARSRSAALPARVAALVRALELDEEPLPAEGARQRGGAVRVATPEPVPRAAGEADEPLIQLGEQRGVERRRREARPAGRGCARARRSGAGRGSRSRSPSRRAASRASRPSSVTSAPVIGRTPSAFAACANSSEP